jgi:hypothetical protein
MLTALTFMVRACQEESAVASLEAEHGSKD